MNAIEVRKVPRDISSSSHFFREPSPVSVVTVVMPRRDRLASLQVVEPCPVSWSSMAGDDQVRFCGKCRKNVYNVAALSRAEAVALIERAEGGVCIRLTRRPDGTIATGDCWAALRRARRRGLLAFAVALPAIVLAQLWSQAFGLRALYGIFHRPPPPVATQFRAIPELPPIEPASVIELERQRHHFVMGKMAPPRPSHPRHPRSGDADDTGKLEPLYDVDRQ
jgi:hypothetical protein